MAGPLRSVHILRYRYMLVRNISENGGAMSSHHDFLSRQINMSLNECVHVELGGIAVYMRGTTTVLHKVKRTERSQLFVEYYMVRTCAS